MNKKGYLLDTHIFLWYINKSERLSTNHKELIRDTRLPVFLSVASVWECVIKQNIQKISFPEPASVYLPKQREQHWLASLGFSETTLTFLQKLPAYHRDPFDRLLISQTLENQLILLTEDDKIKRYDVPVI